MSVVFDASFLVFPVVSNYRSNDQSVLEETLA